MAKSPLTVTVITDTHYYAKSNGVEGAAYDAANTKSQLLLIPNQSLSADIRKGSLRRKRRKGLATRLLCTTAGRFRQNRLTALSADSRYWRC